MKVLGTQSQVLMMVLCSSMEVLGTQSQGCVLSCDTKGVASDSTDDIGHGHVKPRNSGRIPFQQQKVRTRLSLSLSRDMCLSLSPDVRLSLLTVVLAVGTAATSAA